MTEEQVKIIDSIKDKPVDIIVDFENSVIDILEPLLCVKYEKIELGTQIDWVAVPATVASYKARAILSYRISPLLEKNHFIVKKA